MSLLRIQCAARLLSSVTTASRRVPVFQVRHESSKGTADRSIEPAPKPDSSDPPSQESGDSSMISQQDASQAMASHQPDYNAPQDFFTSPFSPIPKRIMDGSEPGESVAAAVLSGAPIDLQARTVRIYRPAKTATQSGDWHGHHWRMDWDVLHKGHRWENPMMGWQSSADMMQGTHLNFKSKEAAILFAQKQGYEYFVQEPNIRKFVPKAYANNFMHSPKKLKVVRTK
ncbi:NADH:ubiquinone oxidoreductase 21kD subunit [Xylographa opegraphella]|nr:NADH:ubiquinone oxidoreductase 21kD subunit [Xylographa opegraphella]